MAEQNLIRCLVVDDEPPAREIIRRYIEQIPGLQFSGECGNALQAFAFLQKNSVDLIFLDIRMPQLNGNDFLKTLKFPPKVIFTTAFAEYALEGYELDIVDYLLKPIQFDRFLKAVDKAFQLSQTKPEPAGVEEKKNDSFVYFRADRKMIKVMLRDVLYIESMKDYIKVITNTETIITKQSISSVEAMLPEREFVRIHRSYIVSLTQIKSFTSEIIEIGKTELPIGKLYRNEVLKLLV
ncbi:LytTR family DNA-binding domain-containing protein [Terrimonas sp. NA20]|uniref:LytTR family DNA-binding domain-containing protein n=1 Tax=Terrimonas ginsenosidimutans TaxID=2908004 RepID=A0ABS9KL64_9BACT|nr:LytTR family DNA-binding domain-containing protein [Terrimonas ginsenosidimutans]MCG2613056.1 LytTR family DNA-binding domain-containing protein [Terrimonas ginsenosidimutans]